MKKAYVEKDRCVACGECANHCPRGAVAVYKGCFAKVEEDICVGCGLCARVCPAGCITVREKEDETNK